MDTVTVQGNKVLYRGYDAGYLKPASRSGCSYINQLSRRVLCNDKGEAHSALIDTNFYTRVELDSRMPLTALRADFRDALRGTEVPTPFYPVAAATQVVGMTLLRNTGASIYGIGQCLFAMVESTIDSIKDGVRGVREAEGPIDASIEIIAATVEGTGCAALCLNEIVRNILRPFFLTKAFDMGELAVLDACRVVCRSRTKV